MAEAGLTSLTKMYAFGRGRTKGIRIGYVVYDEFSKTLLLLVVEDEKLDQAVTIILDNVKTGTMGDGKVLISEMEEVPNTCDNTTPQNNKGEGNLSPRSLFHFVS